MILRATILMGAMLTTVPAFADDYVNGYRSNGTYVQPHYRTSPDSSPTTA